jgi:surfeit locus 1 family protein
VRRIVLFSVTIMVGIAAVGLGFWQLGRHRERAERNRLALAGRALPEIIGAPGTALPAERRAVLTGTLDEARQFVLRNRLVRGVPAVVIVTPLRLAGSDTAVLLNRGYVPAPDATTPPADSTYTETTRERFHGILLAVPDRGDGAPLISRGKESWRAMDLATMRARLPYPLADVYLLVEPDSAEPRHTVEGTEYPFRAEPPPLDGGPHLSYAIQWWGYRDRGLGLWRLLCTAEARADC